MCSSTGFVTRFAATVNGMTTNSATTASRAAALRSAQLSPGARNHAVVLGGSIAGLLAARVLADHYAHVTIVERDRLAAQRQRRGVPQGHHAHGLLPRGALVLEELLPGFAADVAAAGGYVGDALADARWHLGSGSLARGRSGLRVIAASRPLIEGTIRARVTSLPNVTILDGYDIVGLGRTPDNRRVISARVTSVLGDGSQILPADLVIDATGRGSRMPRWLIELGYAPPRQDRVNLGLTYTSRVFDVPQETLGADLAIVTSRSPDGGRIGAVVQRIEGGPARVVVSLSGILGERPPADLDDFIRFTKLLHAPDTHDLVDAGEPVGGAFTFRVPSYTRRRYEELTDFPAGVLVMGDAACIFSPTFAQGMTTAALGASVLGQHLREGEPDAGRFFRALAEVLDPAWAMAAGGDLAIPGVTGAEAPPPPLTPQYLADLRQAATKDPALAAAMLRVSALIDPPLELRRLELVNRVNAIVNVSPAAAYWRAMSAHDTTVSIAATR